MLAPRGTAGAARDARPGAAGPSRPRNPREPREQRGRGQGMWHSPCFGQKDSRPKEMSISSQMLLQYPVPSLRCPLEDRRMRTGGVPVSCKQFENSCVKKSNYAV
ncbi:uncharacterized protein LOC121071188 isoform X2 [Cygnus olor]|uniref:uncharacterized protein LOC121071188 isoform X2 n=1 Tax=Cygnus olor TaxID=8869 RepID=UPI001ADEBE03|nr:uncharacterized protein LOC121071188 isoform X2 [Cygnus olor]